MNKEELELIKEALEIGREYVMVDIETNGQWNDSGPNDLLVINKALQKVKHLMVEAAIYGQSE